tara:strand:+ start:1189 stop:3435 length:2247 start_codon:yes stop_codon:yes gene_type:complete
MRIKIQLFVLIFFLLSTKSIAEKVNSIDIVGNDRISKDTIILFSKVSKNDEIINSKQLNEIFKDIYSTNFFSNVEITFENNILTIKVVENPIINEVEFNGIKSKKLQEQIYKTLRLKNKSSFAEKIAAKDLVNIKNSLKSSGFYFSDVQLQIKENLNNSINLIYDINLGDRALISKINFLGNKVFKDRKLRSLITSEETKFWKFISGKKYLDESRMNLDKRLLKNFYLNKGYYRAQITSSFASYLQESNFELAFTINAGKKYYLNQLTLLIPDDFNKDPFQIIISKLEELKGKPYSLNEIQKIIKLIERISLYNDYEFIDAEIYEEIVDNNKLNLKIRIEENTDKYFVNEINIFGNYITEEAVIRNNLLISEGDALNNIIYNKSINELKSLNIFKTVESKIVDSVNDNKKNIDIEIEEKPTGEISAGAGVGSSGGTIAFGVQENNYLGKGIELSANISINEESIKGGIDYFNPKFKNSDKALSFGFNSTVSDKLADYGYKSSDTSFHIGTGFEQYDDLFLTPAFRISYDKIETSNTASDNLKKQKGDYFTTKLTYKIDYDRRNQKFQTTSGQRHMFSQDIPVYSEELSFRNSYEYSKYFEVADNIVTTISFYSAAITALDSGNDVRISQRLYIPSRKLRGFQPGRIGPVDSKDHVGGNYATTINFNTDLPILATLQDTDIKYFFDAANLWGVDYRNNDGASSKIRASTGVAVDWYTPIGPLNFSLTQVLQSKSTDIDETFRFNIGTTF